MTKHKKDGIFPIHKKMPCKPRQVEIREPYVLPSVFPEIEQQEAAARVISFSRQARKWVGVSWSRLLVMIEADVAANERRFRQRQHTRLTKKLPKRRQGCLSPVLAPFIWAGSEVLGLNFTGEPKEHSVPISVVYADGIETLQQGIESLVRKEYLCQKTIGGQAVYFPTLKLIERIMRKHNISAK